MRILTIVLLLLAGGFALWGQAYLVGQPALYQSVHAMGYRAGQILPRGHDDGSKLMRDQSVRLAVGLGERATGPVLSHPERPPASKREALQAREAAGTMLGRLSERIWMSVVVMGCVIGALLAAWRSRRWSIEDHGDGPVDRELIRRRLVRACLMVLPVGLLIGPAFMMVRVFWTGVDDAFIARSTVVGAGSDSVFVMGDTTLSMNTPELVMLYLAVIMTALPTMFVIAMLAMGDTGTIRALWSRSRLTAPARGLVGLSAVQDRFNSKSLMSVTVMCYLMLVVVLWSAPWSTTLARAFWG